MLCSKLEDKHWTEETIKILKLNFVKRSRDCLLILLEKSFEFLTIFTVFLKARSPGADIYSNLEQALGSAVDPSINTARTPAALSCLGNHPEYGPVPMGLGQLSKAARHQQRKWMYCKRNQQHTSTTDTLHQLLRGQQSPNLQSHHHMWRTRLLYEICCLPR